MSKVLGLIVTVDESEMTALDLKKHQRLSLFYPLSLNIHKQILHTELRTMSL